MTDKTDKTKDLMLVDSHCHLESIEDLENVINRAKADGIGKIITVGTSIESSKKSIDIAEKYSSDDLKIYTTVGIHPKDGKSDIEKFGLDKCINTLKQLTESSNKVVGIGEIGLDYYLEGDRRQVTSNMERRFQQEFFEAQMKLAAEIDLPIVIHCRNAWGDVFSLLTTGYRLPTKLKGVFHSFTSDWQAAQKALDLGFYISFSGIVTYQNAKEIQEVAKKVPLERMLVETDSPYLSPEPFRGGPPKLTTRLSTTIRRRLVERNRRVYKKNEPKNVRIVAQFLAGLRHLPFDEIAETTFQNAKQLFGISI